MNEIYSNGKELHKVFCKLDTLAISEDPLKYKYLGNGNACELYRKKLIKGWTKKPIINRLESKSIYIDIYKI